MPHEVDHNGFFLKLHQEAHASLRWGCSGNEKDIGISSWNDTPGILGSFEALEATETGGAWSYYLQPQGTIGV